MAWKYITDKPAIIIMDCQEFFFLLHQIDVRYCEFQWNVSGDCVLANLTLSLFLSLSLATTIFILICTFPLQLKYPNYFN